MKTKMMIIIICFVNFTLPLAHSLDNSFNNNPLVEPIKITWEIGSCDTIDDGTDCAEYSVGVYDGCVEGGKSESMCRYFEGTAFCSCMNECLNRSCDY